MTNRAFAAALLAAFTTLSFAQDNSAPREIIDKFKAMYPNTTFKEVRKSQLEGLYEVVMGSNVAYTDASGRFFLFGHLFDMQQQVDLTAQRKLTSRRAEFPHQFLGNAIKTVKGDGTRVVAVFSDPDCQYCRKLEVELARLDNVTIYTFLYPLEQLHPEAKTKAIAVWCAPDRATAWADTVLAGRTPKLVACENPVNENLVLGSRLGVNGTPTLIAADGRVMPGAAPAEQIDRWLSVTPAVGVRQ